MIAVRNEKIDLFLDNKLLSTWEPRLGDLSLSNKWKFINSKAVGIGIYNGTYAFYDISVRPINGTGNQLINADEAKLGAKASATPIPLTSTRQEKITPDKNQTSTIYPTPYLNYLTLRDRAISELTNGKNNVARKIIIDAISNPAYAAFNAELQLDLTCVTLADENLAAVAVGAKSLIDIREFTLEELSGNKILLGRSQNDQVKAVNDSGLTIETKIGTGYLHREIPFTQLSPGTRAELARDAQKNKPDAELRSLVGSMLQQKPDTKPSNMAFLRAWVKKASGKDGQAALAAHLNKQLNELEIVITFDQRLRDIELQAPTKDPETFAKPLADLAKEMAEASNNPELWQRHKNVSELISKRQGEISAENAAKKAAELARLASVVANEK